MIIAGALNIMAWAGKRATWKHGLLNVVLQLLGIRIFVYACSIGSVASATPPETGALLFFNIILQSSFQKKKPTAGQVAGTILVIMGASVVGVLGPESSETTEVVSNAAVWALVSAPMAISWCCVLACLSAASIILICFDNELKAFAYSIAVAIATAEGASTGKFLTMTHGHMFYEFLSFYAFCGVGSIAGAGWAGQSGCNLTTFMASNECFKILFVALNDIFIWGNMPRSLCDSAIYMTSYALVCAGATLATYGEGSDSRDLSAHSNDHMQSPMLSNAVQI